MHRFAFGILAALVFLSVSAADAYAHRARVYNNSNIEIRVIIYHFSDPSTYWKIPELDPGDKSRINNLRHGWRIIAVADAITDEVLVLQSFKQEDQGMRIKITGNSPNLQIQTAYVVAGQDP